jgi:hypothetical protein
MVSFRLSNSKKNNVCLIHQIKLKKHMYHLNNYNRLIHNVEQTFKYMLRNKSMIFVISYFSSVFKFMLFQCIRLHQECC